MDNLKKRLRSDLTRNPAVQIRKTASWQFPVLSYSSSYHRVKRTQMDILVKMMLLTFGQAPIRRAANLAELLLVEELFIEDLLKKMLRMGLIRLENGCYVLTPKGEGQLGSGVMEEELEEETAELYYSPIHDEIWPENDGSFPEIGEELPLYRYIEGSQHELDEERVLSNLSDRFSGVDEEGFQTAVAAVNSFEEQHSDQMPCLEFQLYNREQDTYYARVWNTWLGRWDETLESQIEERERLEWRKSDE